MTLRDMALDALAVRKMQEVDREREIKLQRTADALARVERSPLGEWFPDVIWLLHEVAADGTTLVREAGGLDLLLGVKIVGPKGMEQGPDEWEVAVYAPNPVGFTRSWNKVQLLTDAADLGEYIDRTEPKPRDFAMGA